MADGYWIHRISDESNKLYDLSLKEYRKQLKKAYKASMADIENEMLGLYLDISNDKASLNDLYRYGRYTRLYNSLGDMLVDNGKQEYKLLDNTLSAMYGEVNQLIADLAPLDVPIANKRQIAEVVKAVWATDGKSFSDRIWLDKADLQQRLGKGLINTVATGTSKDKLVASIRDNMGVGFNQSDRIVRTELTRTLNQAAADSYISAGVTEYQILAAEDERTCDVCGKMNGKRFAFRDMQVGVNCPPLHPFAVALLYQ